VEGITTAPGTGVRLSTENFAKPHANWLLEGSRWLAKVCHCDWLLRRCPTCYADWRLKMARIGLVFFFLEASLSMLEA
jgi:hypothetical protein